MKYIPDALEEQHAKLQAEKATGADPEDPDEYRAQNIFLAGDKRWQRGNPPKGNANFAWVQHIVHHLAPEGVAGFVLANGSMSSNQSCEGGIGSQSKFRWRREA